MAKENLINFKMTSETQDPTVSRTEMPSIGSFAFFGMIPAFSGEPTQRVSDFFSAVDEIAVLAYWTDRQRLGSAKCKLRGIAREYAWHDFQIKDVTDYQTFKTLMLQRFLKAPYTIRLQQFHTCTQQ